MGGVSWCPRTYPCASSKSGEDVNDRVAGLKRHGEALYEESRELMIDSQKAFQRRAP
jgi:hypothetical protein